MEKEVKELMKKVDELEMFKAEYLLKFQELEKKVEELESGSLGTGVYLEGCPDFATEYIKSENKKDGE